MQDNLRKIIADGILAPSGENCQPWKFVIDKNTVKIFNVPTADQSLYNFKQRGSYVAEGALIENMVLSAEERGYKAEVSIFPAAGTLDLVATITFAPSVSQKNPLYESIPKRCTNRKTYTGQKLSHEQKQKLGEAARSAGGEFRLVDDEASLKTLGRAMAVNEKVLFENKKLHDFFYTHILWKEAEQRRSGGFYIKTLEFLPHQLKGVKLFKNWFILNLLNKLVKVSDKIVAENAEKYAGSGSIGIIVANGNTDTDFVNAGRAVERVWLTATSLGLAVHPCTGVLYFMERIKGGDTSSFSPIHIELIKSAYNDIVNTFGVSGKTIPMLFRIGFSDGPSAKAMRVEPKVEIKS